VRNCRGFAATLTVALTMAVAGAAGWFATAGATVAGAATSHTAGLLTQTHARHSSSPSAASLRPADIIALVVALMAVCAIVFVIVTYVRHRKATG
jgi:hypothetical protein